MATSCSFEDVNGAISWSRLEAVLSPQRSSHDCRRIVFEVVQRLKSKRYETVLNTFTLLHTYSVNASTDALKPLASDHIYNVFAEIQKGKSNTLAAGLAQLLHDWKHMFKDEGLGAKFDQLYHDVLPRAAPQIRPSAPAERYLKDPPTGAETFRKPLHKGFDFALFNQKARRIAYASGAAHPTGASYTGGSSNMPHQHAAPAVPNSSFYRATTLPTPTSDKVNLPSKQPSGDVPNTPVHAVHDQASPTSSGAQSPSPLAADRSNPPTPASLSALPAPRPTEPPKPQSQSQIPSLVSRPKVPTPTPAFSPAQRTGDRNTLDNYTKDSVLSYLDSAPLDTTMPEPPAAPEPPPKPEPAPARRPDTSTSTSSSRLRTLDPPSESDAGVAGNSISRLQDRLAEDFGSPKHPPDKAAAPTLATLSSTDMRSATMPPLVHCEGSGVTEDSNCVVSEIISSQPGGRQYMPATADEEAAEAGSALQDEAVEVAPAQSDVRASEIAGKYDGDATSHAAMSGDPGEATPLAPVPEPPAEPLPAEHIDAEPQVPATQSASAPSSAPVGQPPKWEADVTPASATVPAGGAAAGAAGGRAGAQVPKEGPHTMALKMLAGGPPGAATMSFKDCAPRNIVRQASDLLSSSHSAAKQDTLAVVREARRQATPLQPTPEEEEENSSQVMAATPGTGEITDAAFSSKLEEPLTEGLSRQTLWAKELIDALVTNCELVGRFRRLVQAARDDGNVLQESMFLELGTTQAQTCRQQRQQLHPALAFLGEKQDLKSQLLEANDMCSLELRRWELAVSSPHGADSRPGQPLQELCLRPNLESNSPGSPDAAMMIKAAQLSVDVEKVTALAIVARQPALRLRDPSYVAALANATQRHAH